MASACGLSFLAAWRWALRMSDPREQGEGTWHVYGLALDVTQYPFCCTLLVKVVTKVHPVSRRGNINLITL